MRTSRNMGLVLGLIASVAYTMACNSDEEDSSSSSASGGDGSGVAGAAGEPGAMGGSGGSAMAGSGGSASGGDPGMGGAAGAPPSEPTIVDVAVEAGSFTSLVGALQAAELVEALSGDGPFTVFAPDDAAFAAFEEANPGVLDSLSTEELTAVLTYHVVVADVRSTDLVDGSIVETLNGNYVGVDLSDGVKIGGASVTAPDVEGSNGVIHVIDQIILPPSENLVETAVSAGSFTQLAGALVATGLDSTLAEGGPFTVLAPTDDAFDAFEAANPGVLGGLSTDALSDILLYHVVDGWVGAADLVDGASVPTLLADASVTVDLSSGVMINSSSVTAANVLATNGVIHVIDEILLPPSP